MTFKTNWPLGANFNNVLAGTTTDGAGAEWPLSTLGLGVDGSEWVYVQAGEAITQYMTCYITEAGQALKVTKAAVDAGRKLGVAQVAFSDNDFGWLMRRSGSDTAKVKVLASAAPNVRLYSSGTAGVLDDTDASQSGVYGIVIRATAGTSAANGNGLTIAATIEYPHGEATA